MAINRESLITQKGEKMSDEVKEAIAVVQKHLVAEWVSDGCMYSPCIGCVSCNAWELHRKLQALYNAIDDEPAFAPI